MIPFQTPDVRDVTWVRPILESEGLALCNYSFPVLFCWKDAYGFQYAPLEKRLLIRLNSSLEYGVLTITMDNSFDGQAQQEGGKFLSSKRAGAPGVGLSSIRAVAKAHQGDARFEAKGTTFLSSVYCRL